MSLVSFPFMFSFLSLIVRIQCGCVLSCPAGEGSEGLGAFGLAGAEPGHQDYGAGAKGGG